jgi:Trk K+ transport system NAD-binding subunit
MYLILGCNELSYELAQRLKKGGAELLLVDSSQEKLSELREFNVKVGDFCNPEFLKQIEIQKAHTILISTLEFDKVLGALKALSRVKEELKVDPMILSLVPDALVEKEVRRLGASEVIPIPQVLGENLRKQERGRPKHASGT